MLEKNISHEFTENKKTEFELELLELKKLIKTNEDQLSGLHKENSKTFIIASIVIFLFFLVYGFYSLIFGY